MALGPQLIGAVAGALLLYGYLRGTRREKIQERIYAGKKGLGGITIVGKIIATDDAVESPLSAQKGVLISTWAVMPERDHQGLPVKVRATIAVPFFIRTTDGDVVRIAGDAFDVAVQGSSPRPRDKKREEAFMVARGRHAISALAATFHEAVLYPGMWVQANGDHLEDEEPAADGAPRKRLVALAGKRLAIDRALPPAQG
jgi:hypothetical protein